MKKLLVTQRRTRMPSKNPNQWPYECKVDKSTRNNRSGHVRRNKTTRINENMLLRDWDRLEAAKKEDKMAEQKKGTVLNLPYGKRKHTVITQPEIIVSSLINIQGKITREKKKKMTRKRKRGSRTRIKANRLTKSMLILSQVIQSGWE